MLAFLVSPSLAAALSPAAPYYPGPHPDWERRTPAQVGMNAQLLDVSSVPRLALPPPSP